MGKNLASGAAILAVLAISITILVSPTARSALTFAVWDPDDGPLQCTGSDELVLEGKTLSHPLHPLIVAGQGCQLTLRDCSLKAKRPIAVEGEVVLRLEGGTIEADEIALTAAGKARVELRGTTLVGTQNALLVNQEAAVEMKEGRLEGLVAVLATDKARVSLAKVTLTGTELAVKATGNAEVLVNESTLSGKTEVSGEAAVGVNQTIAQARAAMAKAAKQAAAELDRYEKYAAGGCDGVVACLQKADIAGLVDLEIKMNVDAKGKVKSVRQSGVPPEAKRCVEKNAKQKKIARYKGPGGLWTCTVAGTVMPGSDAADKRTTFVPKETK